MRIGLSNTIVNRLRRNPPLFGSQTMDSASRVGAVIVTHHPDLSVLWQLLVSIARQTQEVILVDNGSSAECVEALAKFAGGSPHRHLIAKPDNQGIAAAQNQGIGLSMALGCTHILLLDHDSIPTDTMVEQLLLLERRLLTNNVKVGAVGPTIV